MPVPEGVGESSFHCTKQVDAINVLHKAKTERHTKRLSKKAGSACDSVEQPEAHVELPPGALGAARSRARNIPQTPPSAFKQAEILFVADRQNSQYQTEIGGSSAVFIVNPRIRRFVHIQLLAQILL